MPSLLQMLGGAMTFPKGAAFLVIVTCMIAECTASPSAQATVVMQNLKIPFTAHVFVPCANAGAGELVTVAGTLHLVVQLSFDAAGSVHLKTYEQPQRVIAFGQTTGAIFQARGVTHEHSNRNSFTFLDTLRLIGQGPVSNFSLYQLVHVTVNANREISAFVDHSSAECR